MTTVPRCGNCHFKILGCRSKCPPIQWIETSVIRLLGLAIDYRRNFILFVYMHVFVARDNIIISNVAIEFNQLILMCTH